MILRNFWRAHLPNVSESWWRHYPVWIYFLLNTVCTSYFSVHNKVNWNSFCMIFVLILAKNGSRSTDTFKGASWCVDKSWHNFGILPEYEHESKQVVVFKSIISSFLPVINFEEGISFLILVFVTSSFYIVNLFQNL